MTDFVPHIITGQTIEGEAYYTNSGGSAHHLGYARALPKDEAERRAAAWKRAEVDNDCARYARDPEEDDRSGVYHITVEATTWEALKAAQVQIARWEAEARLEEEEADDDRFDDQDDRTPEELAAEEAQWQAYLAEVQPFVVDDLVIITDELHPHRGARGVVTLVESSGYVEIKLGAGLTWGWAKGVTLQTPIQALEVEGGPVTIDREIGGKLELVAAFATIGAAESFLAQSATIDPDDLEEGRYGINAPHGAQSDDEALVIAHALSAKHGRPFTPNRATCHREAHAFNFDYHPDD